MKLRSIALGLGVGLSPCCMAAAPALPAVAADGSAVTVSGISSGGYMAVQFQVAYSKLVKGAGILAAGPYDCADGSALRAGGRDNGGPGLRSYGENYYPAFVISPDGHNIEAVCHAPEGV